MLYFAPMPASQAAATLASLKVLRARPDLPARARANAELFARELNRLGIDTGLSHGTAVVPAMTGSSVAAVRLSSMLRENGIIAYGLFHPVVPENLARVRFFVSAAHLEEDLVQRPRSRPSTRPRPGSPFDLPSDRWSQRSGAPRESGRQR